jgi:hypothetical protein
LMLLLMILKEPSGKTFRVERHEWRRTPPSVDIYCYAIETKVGCENSST